MKWMCFPNRKTPIGNAIDLYLRRPRPPHPTCERQFVSSGADIRVLRFGRQLELSDEAVHRLFSVAPAAACLLALLLGLLLLVM